ncbi:MAG: DUF2452 domain-containing protein [bacterium]|nr:DUF2452 domain-containing protein [bacterium]
MINPIDKEKVAEFPGLLIYPHHLGSVVVRPEDEGKLKSRALSAMREQTAMALQQIQKQVELLARQAKAIKHRADTSELIYEARISFEPFVGHTYHLYKREEGHQLMMIGPDEWGRSKKKDLEYVSSVKLLSDHTWEIIKTSGVEEPVNS